MSAVVAMIVLKFIVYDLLIPQPSVTVSKRLTNYWGAKVGIVTLNRKFAGLSAILSIPPFLVFKPKLEMIIHLLVKAIPSVKNHRSHLVPGLITLLLVNTIVSFNKKASLTGL